MLYKQITSKEIALATAEFLQNKDNNITKLCVEKKDSRKIILVRSSRRCRGRVFVDGYSEQIRVM